MAKRKTLDMSNNGHATTNGVAVAEEPATKMVNITIPRLNIRNLSVKIVGDSPLITHRFSEKARRMIEDKQQKQAKQAKEARDPNAEYEAAMYRFKDGSGYGIPAVTIKCASIFACSHIAGITKVVARGALHIISQGLGEDGTELIRINGDDPIMRTDMVRIGMGVSDVRYRPQFTKWSCEFVVRFNANVLSVDQIYNLINTAGFCSGLGEWRPERGGSNGMFHVPIDGVAK